MSDIRDTGTAPVAEPIPDVLADLVASSLADMVQRQDQIPQARVEELAASAPRPIDVLPAFQSQGLSVIAEVKRASPSHGDLAAIPDPASLARTYAEGGATAISVLTEHSRFRGSLNDLVAVRAAVDIPVLRKDFICDPYQVWEARAAGADLVLLIVAALEQQQLVDLQTLAGELGMRALVEVHTEDEVARANDAGAAIIGVNNRNLKTLDVDRDTFARLAPLVRNDAVKVAESGLLSAADVHNAHHHGADVVLVGQALVTGDDPAQVLRTFLED
ncbi:indole-3-glycerol phosphate synthase TrpC [Parenemella sanctibonifatiensis]|uniref:Indole-3-glycerol phosphate synthase n=1 Tax=Parenemella sanctibonifatiensis TaxID=2016505 RepID=A0A255EHJ6_9ACTN|nr:indole-3-glycerol phosphate synthase TrpC [Parenemella sanctibonifatiensis]OYN90997.1 indole-3-glycerol-phosphate synthase [Parenemella sanctibonifatiensis]